ncbi:hypothetical protein QM806_04510 [Rhodococcus sp. IEGM 1351]|uniref:hypothetical protein n=1 Tax=Rhodococcus sp. IEGM 1351 TaxID=3047089 RepID=UPI0024B6C6C2|nr:hypothetical protein [Rhodococcus sp. IEGM 1351]MDI9934717.1 hypothetical protein [Rhodococcus sp. IEGM 1351]
MDKSLVPANLEDKLVKYRIDADEANTLLAEYGAPFTEAGEILANYETVKVSDESDTATMKLARDQRLKLRKVRTSVENKRKELKADIVKRGNAIDGVARFVKEVITPAEEYLQLQEDYAKVKEAERQASVKAERVAKLSPYAIDLSLYSLDSMTDEQFNDLHLELKTVHEAKIAAAKKAEEEAKAQAEAERREQERIRAENERLRQEAEVRRKAESVERERRVALERAERERVAQEEQARLKAEEAERQALLAPDKEKLLSFGKALEVIRTEKLPAVKSKQAQDVVNLIDEMLVKMQAVINDKAAQL